MLSVAPLLEQLAPCLANAALRTPIGDMVQPAVQELLEEGLALQPPAAAGLSRADAEMLLCAQALALRRCSHPGCTNLAGTSEADLPAKKCSACGAARYCSAACQRAHWKQRGGHKAACALLAQAAGRGTP